MAEDKKQEEKAAATESPDTASDKAAETAEKAKAEGKGKKAAKSKTTRTRKKTATAKSEVAKAASEPAKKAGRKTKAAKKEEAKPTAEPEKTTEPALKYEETDGYGFLIFDMPGKSVNIFTHAVMQELDAKLDELAGKTDLKALLIMSAKENNFIAGADVSAIKDVTDPKEGEQAAREGQRIFSKLAALPYPTIAVINGSCMGGGLEMALACDYRLARASKSTKIGLPEVKLGIIPGFGGTQRLPRLIGIQKALDYILTGKAVDAKRAYRDGIVDRVIPDDFPPEYTREAALAFAREIQSPSARERIKKRRQRANLQTLLLEKNPLGRKLLFDQARKRTMKQTKGFYPAPIKAIEAVEKGLEMTLPEGLKLEARLLGECVVTDVSKNLIRVFWMTEELKRDKGVADYAGPIQEFHRIGVLGAGVMGGGIAQLMAYYDMPVRMKDINLAAVAKGMEQAGKVFKESVKKRRMKPAEMQRKMALISGGDTYAGFDKVDLVIEAVVERLDVKKKVFAELDGIVPPHAVLASNTSSLPVTEMAAATQRPEKVAGFHFFNPVHRMPLVEVIRAEQSSDETIASLVAFARKIGKTPIVVKDSPGFLVNRILAPYMNEAASMLQEGQTVEHIDQAITRFGMPMGPLTLYDEVGIDITYHVGQVLEKAFGDKMKASPVIARMNEVGRLGKKSGKGFYIHRGKERKVDPEVYSVLGELRHSGEPLPIRDIQDRCILLMVNEAARCLEDEVVRHPRDVDIGMIFGTGFPPFRGGLLHYADHRGLDQVVARMNELAEKYGERFAPAQLLVDMAKKGERFFDD